MDFANRADQLSFEFTSRDMIMGLGVVFIVVEDSIVVVYK